MLGLTISKAVEKKKSTEAEFEKKVEANVAFKEKYSGLLSKLNQAYKDIEPYAYARDYYNEIIPRIELFTIAAQLKSVMTSAKQSGDAYVRAKTRAKTKLDGLYPEYNSDVDKKLFEGLLEIYVKGQKDENVSPLLKKMLAERNGSYAALAEYVYANSFFTDQQKVADMISEAKENDSLIINDPAYKLYSDINELYLYTVAPKVDDLQANINKLQRSYMQAQMDVFTNKTFYPDANSTLRVTYGNVKGYKPRDAVSYHFYTYLEGLMEKYKPGDYEFDVPQKLIDLYNKKDYGQYAAGGKLPVCFIAANHTTGGNSGSPALDAFGNLVGLNFDRVWEGTMSDINYNKDICRNIMVDIRYVLFIVDKFAGAKHLVDEMTLVKNAIPAK